MYSSIIIVLMSKVTYETNKQTVRILFFWLFTAFLAGIVGTSIVFIFTNIYSKTTFFLLNYINLPVFLYPVFGAFIVGVIVYRLEPKSMGEGIPSYLESLNEHNGNLSFKETFFKFWAALITLSTF
ncbi:MAG: chloride channel protein, partial [Spirochaetales bacterium]|nr:chloride channel protein [Spirochaetales bacterium]